jgi:hypothetical protein
MHISCCKHIQAFRRVCRPCPYSAARLMLVHVVNGCVTPYRRTVPLSRSPYVVMLRDNRMISRQQRLLCGLLLLCAGLHHIRLRWNARHPRRASIRRVRPCLSTVVRDLSEGEYRRVFRMQRSIFTYLLNVLLPDLRRDVSMALRSSGGRVEPDIRLALTLRLLAGASYLDTAMLFAVSRSSCYAVFHETISSIPSRLELPGLPLEIFKTWTNCRKNFQSRDYMITFLSAALGRLMASRSRSPSRMTVSFLEITTAGRDFIVPHFKP